MEQPEAVSRAEMEMGIALEVFAGLCGIMTDESYLPEAKIRSPLTAHRHQSRRRQALAKPSCSAITKRRDKHASAKGVDRSPEISKRSHIGCSSKSIKPTPADDITRILPHNPDPISSHKTRSMPRKKGLRSPALPPIGMPPRSQSRPEPRTHFLGPNLDPTWRFAYRAYQRAGQRKAQFPAPGQFGIGRDVIEMGDVTGCRCPMQMQMQICLVCVHFCDDLSFFSLPWLSGPPFHHHITLQGMMRIGTRSLGRDRRAVIGVLGRGSGSWWSVCAVSCKVPGSEAGDGDFGELTT